MRGLRFRDDWDGLETANLLLPLRAANVALPSLPLLPFSASFSSLDGRKFAADVTGQEFHALNACVLVHLLVG